MKKTLFITSIVVIIACILFFFAWFLKLEGVIDGALIVKKMALMYQPVLYTLLVAIVCLVFTSPVLGNRSIKE